MEEFQIQLKVYLILSKKLDIKLHFFLFSKYFISSKIFKKKLKKTKTTTIIKIFFKKNLLNNFHIVS